MAPPPVTPTPHRFLVPKRSQPRSETPRPVFQPSGQQFQATPRFSLRSTPRAGPSSSSALTPFRHRGTPRDVEIDSSPPPLAGADDIDNSDHEDDGRISVDRIYEQGSIDYEQESVVGQGSTVQESSPIQEVESGSQDHSTNEERRAKRRRISVSSPDLGIEESHSSPNVKRELDIEMRDVVLDVEFSFTGPVDPENDISSDQEVLEDDIEDFKRSPPHHQEQASKAHQPMFQKAPHFKPAEIPEGAPRPEPLPDAFSPRRKGAKYVQGGLAAELRDWLVDVEAGTSYGPTGPTANRNEEWVARIRVDSLHGANRSARGMTLVLGRQVLNGRKSASGDGGVDESEEAAEVLATNTVRLILAGPGRLSGLGVGNHVAPGVLLCIARPTWEVVLDGLGRWGVACDWAVLH